MGLRPDDYEPRRHHHEKAQTATDELVRVPSMELSRVFFVLNVGKLTCLVGHGTIQEEDAEVTNRTRCARSRFSGLS